MVTTVAASLKKQTLLLALGNGYTRCLGFFLRLALARRLGAQALGVMEMTGSVTMLALTPVTAGTASAVSRLTAKRPACDQPQVLLAARWLVLRASLALTPALLALTPLLARLLGDVRTAPGLVCAAPAIALLGLCTVYSGWHYGRGETRLPALCECAEQTARCLLALGLTALFHGAPVAWRAALPQAAESVAALCAVLLMMHASPLPPRPRVPSAALRRQIVRLCVPAMLSRLCVTGTRALNAVLLPACLRLSGLSAPAATAQFGLLSGMAMPLMMLPSILTGALGMVASPALSAREERPEELRRVMRRMLGGAALTGGGCTLLLLLGAEGIGRLYRTPELSPVVRWLSPAALLFALHQVMCGMIAGLGLQRRALTGTLLSSAASLCLTALLTRLPGVRIFGAVLAQMAGQLMQLGWDAALLRRALSARHGG